LDEAIEAGRHVALIAGSGYGKTSLLADWARDRRSCWLSLDPEDAEPGLFLGYLVGALGRTIPGFRTAAASMLTASHDRAGTLAALDTLLVDLDEQGGDRLVLILDDYHLAESPTLAQVIERFLRYLPVSIRLVFTTRCTPEIGLAAMQARRALQVLDESHLALDPAELRACHPNASEPEIEAIRAATGGWPASVGMAPDVLAAYLQEEVLDPHPEGVSAFLCKASLVDVFDARCCAEALEVPFDGEFREHLIRHRLIRPAGEESFEVPQPWRGLLRRRAWQETPQPELMGTLRRIGDHLWARGQEASALRCWIEAGAGAYAAARLESVAEPWLHEGRLDALASAILALGPHGRSPELTLALGEAHRHWGEFERAAALTEEAGTAFELTHESLGAARARLTRAMIAASRGETTLALELVTRSRSELEANQRGLAEIPNLEGVLALFDGDPAMALRHFERSRRQSQRQGDRYAEARAAHNLGVCHAQLGDLARALECYEQAWAPSQGGAVPAVWMTPVNRAQVLTYLGRHDEACAMAEEALTLVRRFRRIREEGYALRALGYVMAQQGDLTGAQACYEDAEHLARRSQDSLSVAYSLNFQADLAITAGDLEAAERLSAEAIALIGGAEAMGRVPEFFQVRARLLMISGQDREGREMLGELKAMAQEKGWRHLLSELDTLEGGEGDRPAAPMAASLRPEPLLEIRCFAGMRVSVGGQELSGREWRNMRARLLLAVLLDHPEGVGKPQLADWLYDAGEEATDGSLNMAILRLRKSLEPGLQGGTPSRYILRADGVYTFNRQAPVSYDVLEFESSLRAARLATGERRAKLLLDALEGYHGDYLPEFDLPWVHARRIGYRNMALEACRALIELAPEHADADQVLRRALAIDPLSEEFHREQLLRYLESGEHRRALEHFAVCCRLFEQGAGIQPPEDLFLLAEQARRS
jgi:LuxR family maltose regulon positive regulatory protein